MDKYQEFLINLNNSYYGFATNGQLSKDTILIDNKIVLTQNEDITINDYMLYIANESISSIYAIKGETQIELSKELDPVYSSKGGNQNRFFVPISFEDKLESLKIVFKNKLADDLTLAVSYVLADKDKYYAKKEQERKEALIKNTQIKHSTGADLVNIYFQPCNEQCVKTEIELWIAKGKRENHHGMLAYVPRLIGGEPEQLMAKYIIEEGIYFKAINGLAKGVYGYKIKQYDKDNNIIMESEFNYFDIGFSSRPVGRVNR